MSNLTVDKLTAATIVGGGGTTTFNTLNLNAATNQIVLDADGTYTGTVSMAALSGSSKTWTFPNVTGTVVLVDNSVTLQSKTLDNTNTISVKDTLFTVQDDGDPAKLLAFQCSGITTGNTRTLTIPDASGTIMLTSAIGITVQTYRAELTAVNGGTTTIASATSTAIGAAVTDYISITGTTTITSFDTVAAGIRRFVTFTGILTLTYNGTTLILPTAASITTAAGDAATFQSLGSGNWKCLHYTRASGAPLLGSSFADGSIPYYASGAEAADNGLVWEPSNNVLIINHGGASNIVGSGSVSHKISVATATSSGISIIGHNSSNVVPRLELYSSKNGTAGTYGANIAGDLAGAVMFSGVRASSVTDIAKIQTEVQSVTGVIPSGRLRIYTTNTSGTSTIALTIDEAQITTLANALPVASGGTGGITAQAARQNLNMDQGDIYLLNQVFN